MFDSNFKDEVVPSVTSDKHKITITSNPSSTYLELTPQNGTRSPHRQLPLQSCPIHCCPGPHRRRPVERHLQMQLHHLSQTPQLGGCHQPERFHARPGKSRANKVHLQQRNIPALLLQNLWDAGLLDGYAAACRRAGDGADADFG